MARAPLLGQAPPIAPLDRRRLRQSLAALDGAISGVVEIARALASSEVVEEAPDGVPERLDGPFGGSAQKRLQLAEELLDRIEIGRVGRQVEQDRTGRLD